MLGTPHGVMIMADYVRLSGVSRNQIRAMVDASAPNVDDIKRLGTRAEYEKWKNFP